MIKAILRLMTVIAVLAPLTPSSPQEGDVGGVVRLPDGRIQFSLRGLCISEVAAGPFQSYIELYNNTNSQVSLDGYSIETATGQYSLSGLGAPLAPQNYFLLLQGHPSEVGVSTDPEVPCIIIDEPTCGHVTDTVLLRNPSGVVTDAMSYGVTQDTSSRYLDAVAAGQFASGDFLYVGTEFAELVIGRDRTNTDTNSIANWGTSGGPDALVGSPFSANTEFPSSEEMWGTFFQAFLAGVVSPPYFDITMCDASYAGYSGTGPDSSATHTIVFEGSILGPGQWSLIGEVSNHLELLLDGRIRCREQRNPL
ncbi:MAG: lamin tail domain-containing protein [Candidatus Thermoplasmatota archaeon]